MSALVSYESSDDEEDVVPERPSKMMKTERDDVPKRSEDSRSVTAQTSAQDEVKDSGLVISPSVALPAPHGPQLGPVPQTFSEDVAEVSNGSPALSPYSVEQQRIRELTMPTVPNFSIPDAPSPPPVNSEEAATLSATTKKFERFLELKKQGVHFNERLQNSASLQNPSLLPKLMEFAGIGLEDSYALTLPEDAGGLPTRWPEEVYVENLMKWNERKLAEDKKRMRTEGKIEFVSGVPNHSAGSSTTSISRNNMLKKHKSRFDQR